MWSKSQRVDVKTLMNWLESRGLDWTATYVHEFIHACRVQVQLVFHTIQCRVHSIANHKRIKTYSMLLICLLLSHTLCCPYLSLVVMSCCLLLETNLPLPHPGVEQDPTHTTGKLLSWHTHSCHSILSSPPNFIHYALLISQCITHLTYIHICL